MSMNWLDNASLHECHYYRLSKKNQSASFLSQAFIEQADATFSSIPMNKNQQPKIMT